MLFLTSCLGFLRVLTANEVCLAVALVPLVSKQAAFILGAKVLLKDEMRVWVTFGLSLSFALSGW